MPSSDQERRRVPIQETVTLLLIAAVASFLYNYNSLIPTDGVPDRIDNDYSMTLWNLWHVTESLCHFENPFITTKIYYPIGANLTIHPLTSGFFPLSAAIKFLSGNSQLYPLYAYKAAIWLCYALLLVFGHLFLRELGYSRIESFIPAFSVTFSNFCLDHVWHLNIISGFFLPLTAYAGVRLYNKPSRTNCLVLAACLGASIYFTEFSLFIYLSLAFLFGANLIASSARTAIIAKLRLLNIHSQLLSVLFFIGIVAPFVYFFLKSNALPPNPTEAGSYSANLAGFLIPDPTRNPIYGIEIIKHLNSLVAVGMPGHEIFLGYPFLALAVLGAVTANNKKTLWPLYILCVLFFLLSLGPRPIIFQKTYDIKLPFSFFINMPVLGQLRTPVRLIFFSLVLGSIFAAEGLRALTRCQTAAFTTAIVLISLLVASETRSPIPKQDPFVIPEDLLQKITEGSVAILPITCTAEHDYLSMKYQIFHQQPIAYGYLARRSSREIAQRDEQLAQLNPKARYSENFRTEIDSFLAITGTLGIKNILITQGGYPPEFLAALRRQINVIDWPITPAAN